MKRHLNLKKGQPVGIDRKNIGDKYEQPRNSNRSRNEHGYEISRLKERVKGIKAPVGQRDAEILKNGWA